MITLSEQTSAAFLRRMKVEGVSERERASYLRWVRFYLDFCHKYGHPPREEASLAPFLMKLAAKKQPPAAREQAETAVRLLIKRGTRPPAAAAIREMTPVPNAEEARQFDAFREPMAGRSRSFQGSLPAGDAPKRAALAPALPAHEALRSGGDGASWEREYRDLEGAIKLRNYSGKTWQVYRMWVRKLQAFVKSKEAAELDGDDAKRFLTDLAVRQEVAGSTQNQAFNALLFFYRHVLQREFGKLEGVVRAKRKPYVPVVLSRQEVEAVLAEIAAPYRLVALLLYGSGLRLAECVELRVHCFNLEARLLTIHDGKGQKDRSVPLPEGRAGDERNSRGRGSFVPESF